MTDKEINPWLVKLKDVAICLPTGELKKDLNKINDLLLYIDRYLQSFDIEFNGVKLTNSEKTALQRCHSHFREL